jgi:hypothetical protein
VREIETALNGGAQEFRVTLGELAYLYNAQKRAGSGAVLQAFPLFGDELKGCIRLEMQKRGILGPVLRAADPSRDSFVEPPPRPIGRHLSSVPVSSPAAR